MCAASFWVAWEVHQTQCKMNWTEMLNIIKNVLQDFRMQQHVQLSSSQKFDLAREFDFHDCIPNSNDRKGPVSSGGEVRSSGEPIVMGRNKLKEATFMSSGPMQMMMQAGAIRIPPELMQNLGPSPTSMGPGDDEEEAIMGPLPDAAREPPEPFVVTSPVESSPGQEPGAVQAKLRDL
eukprot:s5406_g1.t1